MQLQLTKANNKINIIYLFEIKVELLHTSIVIMIQLSKKQKSSTIQNYANQLITQSNISRIQNKI